MKKFLKQVAQIESCENKYALTFLWFTMDKSDLYFRERLLDARAMQLLLIEAKQILNSKVSEYE
jgi:hypothetical protein